MAADYQLQNDGLPLFETRREKRRYQILTNDIIKQMIIQALFSKKAIYLLILLSLIKNFSK